MFLLPLINNPFHFANVLGLLRFFLPDFLLIFLFFLVSGPRSRMITLPFLVLFSLHLIINLVIEINRGINLFLLLAHLN